MISKRVVALIGLISSGCLTRWDASGLYACSADDTCPTGYTCDDGVCCKPGGTPECPTLPAPNGTCPAGDPGIFYEDRDQDGDGNKRVFIQVCKKPLKGSWVDNGRDCDDSNPTVNSRGMELCNGLDDNCDGTPDEGLTPQRTFYLDQDGDGAGDPAPETQLRACAPAPGYVDVGGDCAPFDPAKKPGAPERCNGLDDDCDGVSDALEMQFADTGAAFACLTGRPGVCATGAFQCAAQPDGGVQRACTATRAAGRETCDRVDDDCDGMVDEQPECGGPTSLINRAGVTVGAVWSASLTLQEMADACQKNNVNASPGTASGATWTHPTAAFATWYAESPAGQPWDLSGENIRLRVAFDVTAAATAWGTSGSFGHPVVYLCGERDDQLIRYVINSSNQLVNGATSFDITLPLIGTSPWIVGRGSGFDTSRVRRVEVMVRAFAGPFTITWRPTTGFTK